MSTRTKFYDPELKAQAAHCIWIRNRPSVETRSGGPVAKFCQSCDGLEPDYLREHPRCSIEMSLLHLRAQQSQHFLEENLVSTAR